jgi:2-oxoglutarate ferredoxin oxidoreductase subunit alpha
MEETALIHGYEAIARGGLDAGCLHFFGYPITPQNEITEYFARELPQRGGRFVQAESESAVAAMLFGAAAAGVRAMTSTASPGWGLMQEGLSHIAWCELPCVIANVQRGGPGQVTKPLSSPQLQCRSATTLPNSPSILLTNTTTLL